MRAILIILLIVSNYADAFSQVHPKLVLTSDGLDVIRQNLGELPLIDISLKSAIEEVDKDIANGIEVPVPKDLGGGYTHERHKTNYLILQKAGVLYQITGKEKYANHVRDVLLEYADKYPNWTIHPATRSYAPGKIFWQCLNDANWLVYMSQAYDCVYNFLDPSERDKIENDLFRPEADHISIHSPQFYNRIHNHAAWANAGVGMMGLVMGDEELIDRSLHGLKTDNPDKDQVDDDGGLIMLPGQTGTGFFAQLDHLFSPDGYYTEGPYYQRYAMYPFVLFSQALENFYPEYKIFEYRDSLLKKSVYALLNLTTSKGEFFPINDAQKGMSWLSRELISSVDIIYHFCGQDPRLLSIARKQGSVLLDDTGLSVATGLKEGREKEFVKNSMELRDGRNGDEGGIGILRAGNPGSEICLLMKYTGQGLSHGHYDKLSFMLYDRGEEVLQDYGMARFVNIEQKNGGGYLPENTSWAKQTIAHNTIIANQQSHFNGDYKTGVQYHSDKYFFFADRDDIHILSAKETNAYDNVLLHRTMAIIQDASFEHPLVLDVFRIEAESKNQYDLPFLFKGQVISTNFNLSSSPQLSAMGKSDGYQHLWLEAKGKVLADSPFAKFSWFNNSRFYTLTSLVSGADDLLFTRLGANDPEFNLRRDPLFIIRKNQKEDAVFVSIIETHGDYSAVSERVLNAKSSMKALELEVNNDDFTAVSFINTNDTEWILILANKDADIASKHKIEIDGKKFKWTGPYCFTKEMDDKQSIQN